MNPGQTTIKLKVEVTGGDDDKRTRFSQLEDEAQIQVQELLTLRTFLVHFLCSALPHNLRQEIIFNSIFFFFLLLIKPLLCIWKGEGKFEIFDFITKS